MFATLRQRVTRLQSEVERLRATLRTTTAQAEAQARQAAAALGVHVPDHRVDADVVDMAAPARGVRAAAGTALKRLGQGVLGLVALAMLGLALWSLGLFVSVSLLAFVIVTRGLGLRVDLSPRGAAA
jgi:hypothetical protein